MAAVLLIPLSLALKGHSKNPVFTRSRNLEMSAGLHYVLEFKEVFYNGTEWMGLLQVECKQAE